MKIHKVRNNQSGAIHELLCLGHSTEFGWQAHAACGYRYGGGMTDVAFGPSVDRRKLTCPRCIALEKIREQEKAK